MTRQVFALLVTKAGMPDQRIHKKVESAHQINIVCSMSDVRCKTYYVNS